MTVYTVIATVGSGHSCDICFDFDTVNVIKNYLKKGFVRLLAKLFTIILIPSHYQTLMYAGNRFYNWLKPFDCKRKTNI